MALSIFLPAQPSSLREDGRLIDSAGRAAAPGTVQLLVLSRALCRFHRFRAPGGLTARQRAQAARAAAETHAPFGETGTLILRTAEGAGIWYWDKTRVAEALGARAEALMNKTAPESVFSAPFEGWRVISALDGFEAQYWQNGALCASNWRRQQPTQDQWTLFGQGVEAPTFPAPALPPSPVDADPGPAQSWRRARLHAPPTWADAEKAAAGAAFCAAGVSAFLVGQALHFDAITRSETARAAQLTATLRADAQTRRVETQLALIQRYEGAMAASDVLGAAAEAFAVANRLGLNVEDWSIDQENVRFTINQTADDVSVRDVVAALEQAPSLTDVEPQFRGRGEGLEFSARLVRP